VRRRTKEGEGEEMEKEEEQAEQADTKSKDPPLASEKAWCISLKKDLWPGLLFSCAHKICLHQYTKNKSDEVHTEAENSLRREVASTPKRTRK
jgi:hypothetical protein